MIDSLINVLQGFPVVTHDLIGVVNSSSSTSTDP
jgi:hypothetical protein